MVRRASGTVEALARFYLLFPKPSKVGKLTIKDKCDHNPPFYGKKWVLLSFLSYTNNTCRSDGSLGVVPIPEPGSQSFYLDPLSPAMAILLLPDLPSV